MATLPRKRSIAQVVIDFLLSSPREIPLLILRVVMAIFDRARRIRLVRLFLNSMQYFLKLLFIILSPALPNSLKQKRALHRLSRNLLIVLIGTLFGFAISYPLNYFGSWWAGTLSGADDHIFYFLSDKKNLEIYTVWAPLYMGFSTAVIFLSVLYWKDLRDLADRYRNVEINQDDHARALAAIVIMSLIAAFFAQRYAYGTLLVPRTTDGKLYWFLSATNGKAAYNIAGLFYLCAIYFKLFFLFVALACYISISIEWTRLILGLAQKEVIGPQERNKIVQSIVACDWIYFHFQCLFVVLVMHNIVWSQSDLGKRGLNDQIAIVFLVMSFVFFMSLPRTYTNIEYKKDPAKFHFIRTHLQKSKEARLVRRAIAAAYFVIYGPLIWQVLERISGWSSQQIQDAVAQAWVAVTSLLKSLLMSVGFPAFWN